MQVKLKPEKYGLRLKCHVKKMIIELLAHTQHRVGTWTSALGQSGYLPKKSTESNGSHGCEKFTVSVGSKDRRVERRSRQLHMAGAALFKQLPGATWVQSLKGG